MTSPIAIFIYRRPDHLRRMLETLIACEGFEQSPIFVFGDGPKTPEQAAAVDETRAVARAMLGERAEYRFQESNRGLANSVIAGVSELTERFGRVIVIEDDLLLAPQFLSFINGALDHYQDDEQVMHVSGFMFDVPELRERNEAVVLPFCNSWGWGTWRRAWSHFDSTASAWQSIRNNLDDRRRFDLDGYYDFSEMMERQFLGMSDSWFIRWYLSVFHANGLSIYPPVSLVANVGFDGSGTHGRGILRRPLPKFLRKSNYPIVFPPSVCIERDLDSLKSFFWYQGWGGLGKIATSVKNWVGRIAVFRKSVGKYK
jgi:hypothetical protein